MKLRWSTATTPCGVRRTTRLICILANDMLRAASSVLQRKVASLMRRTS